MEWRNNIEFNHLQHYLYQKQHSMTINRSETTSHSAENSKQQQIHQKISTNQQKNKIEDE